MRLGAYIAELDAGLAGGRGLRRRPSCPSATATATSSTPATGPSSRTAGFRCSGASPDGRLVEFIELHGHPFWVGTQAHPEFKSRPNRPAPLFREFVGAALDRAEGRDAPPVRPRRRAVAVRRRVRRAERMAAVRARLGEEEIARGVRSHRRRGDVPRPPTAPTFERDVVHHPGAVGGRRRSHDDGTVMLVRQYRAALDARPARDPGRHARRRRRGPEAHRRAASWSRRSGCEAGQLELLAAFHNSPGFSDELGRACTWPPTSPRCPTTARASRSRHMTIERVAARRRAWPMIADGRITDAKTIIGLLAGAATAALAVDAAPARPPLPLEVEEFLTWLAVERGRAPNTLAAYRRDLARATCAWLRRAGHRPSPTVERGRRRRPTSARSASAGWRRPSVARALGGRARRCTASWREEGRRGVDPARRRRGAPGAARAAQGAHRGRGRPAARRAPWATARRPPRPGHPRGALRHRPAHLRAGRPVARRRRPRRRACSGPSARAARSGSCPLGRLAPCGRWSAWLGAGGPAGAGAGAVGPAGRRRGGVPQRSGAAGSAGRGRGASCAALRRRGSGLGGRLSPHVLRHSLRHPHARPRRRHPGGAGAARPRLDQHHAGVHAGLHRAALGGLPDRPPPGRGRPSSLRPCPTSR